MIRRCIVDGIIVYEKTSYFTVGSRRSDTIITPALDKVRVQSTFIDLGNGFGGWARR